MSSLLPYFVSLCVITSWELAEVPSSLLRSVLLLSLLWHWFIPCVYMCGCVHQAKPTLETALKHWQRGVEPCLSYFLIFFFFTNTLAFGLHTPSALFCISQLPQGKWLRHVHVVSDLHVLSVISRCVSINRASGAGRKASSFLSVTWLSLTSHFPNLFFLHA